MMKRFFALSLFAVLAWPLGVAAQANTICCFCESAESPQCILADISENAVTCGELPSIRGGSMICNEVPEGQCAEGTVWCPSGLVDYSVPAPTSGGTSGGGSGDSGAGGAPGSGTGGNPTEGAEGGSGTTNQGGVVSPRPPVEVRTPPTRVIVPRGQSTQEIPPDYGLTNPLGARTIPGVIGGLVQWLGGFAGSLFLLYLLWGGAQWMTARGSDEQVQKARAKIIAASAGIIVVLTAYLLVSAVIGLVPK